MAYDCPVSCTRVLHFSNPGVTYGGDPTGVAVSSASAAYNALSLDNTRVTVANWRQPARPPSGSTCRTGVRPGGRVDPPAIIWTATGFAADAVGTSPTRTAPTGASPRT
jgi:hypothetical protein